MRSYKQLNKIFTKQHGEFSCGIACLAMIVRYYGGNVEQEELRGISGTTTQGATLLGLYHASKEIGFNPSGYEGDMDSLREINEPCILHVVKNQNQEHFVTYFGFSNGKFVIGDPASGILNLTEFELGNLWRSKALLKLEPTESFVKKDSEVQKKREWLLEILKDDYPILTVAFFLGIIIAVLGFVTAIFSQRLIDELLPSGDYEKLSLGIFLFFILLFFRNILEYLRSFFMIRQSKDYNIRLVDSFFSKILYLPKPFFDGTKTGEIISRMNDSRRIQQTVTYIVGNVLIDFLVLIFSIIFLFTYSWKMALIAFASIPLFAVLVLFYNRKIIDAQRNIMVTYAATESLFIDSLQGINEIKVTNKQSVFKTAIKSFYSLYQGCSYKLGILAAQYSFFAQTISTMVMTSVIILGAFWVLSGQLTLGELMSVITIAGIIISSSASLSGVNIRLQEAGVAFDRFYEFIKAKPEFEDVSQDDCKESANVSQEVYLQVKQISYRFVGRKKIFDNISLDLRQNEIVTLFGEVGSGKSTLIQLLQRHYIPEAGEILFKGKSYLNFSIPEWRSYVGVVSQQVKIFNTSVGENICLGSFADERASVLKFCDEYGFSEFFNSLPQGVDTLLGEEGINISGGQQQLIAIARALYHRPSILLLDEPTSAMDAKTEQFVIDLLKRQCKNLAILLITHRERLAKFSDRIYVLENGTISTEERICQPLSL